MKLKNVAKIGAAAVAASLLLSGCAGGDQGGSGDGGEKDGPLSAVLYSSTNETTNDVLINGAQENDLKIELVTGSSGPLFERVKTENPVVADTLWVGNGLQFIEIAEPYRTTEADAILPEALDSENRWTPTNQHIVAFMANVDQIDGGKAPTTWKELTDSKWAGKLIVADPTQSTTAATALFGAYKVLGEADFAKLAANLTVSESSGNVYPAVAQGEYAVGIAYESNIYPYIAGGQAGVEMVYPSDGTFAEFDSILLVAGGPNQDGGKATIDTLLSKDVQEQMLTESFRRPVRTDIDVAEFVDFKPVSELKVVDLHESDDDALREAFFAFWATV